MTSNEFVSHPDPDATRARTRDIPSIIVNAGGSADTSLADTTHSGSDPDATRTHNDADATASRVLPDAPSIPGYVVTSLIAKGGMGSVYAATDVAFGREVAIKTLLPDADPARFVTESKITGRLAHPNIPPAHAMGVLDDRSPYLVMKLVRGRTLAELLKERASPQTDLPRFVQVFEQIAQAVGFAHAQGVVHRDLKPLNVMVGAFGEVQVMDWGLAKDLSVSREAKPSALTEADGDDLALTSAGAIMGTPGYMAPEQARGEPVDSRADVFALGAILAAILTGKPAFVGTAVHETIEKAAKGDLAGVLTRLDQCGADDELVAVAKRSLAVSPDDRPSNAQFVADAVAAYRASVEARLRKAETDAAEAVVREAEQRKRRRVLLNSGVVVTLTLAVGMGVSLWQRNVAVAERNAKQKALEGETAALGKEKEATTQALKRLVQVERGSEILGAVFDVVDVRALKKGVDPLEAVLAKGLLKAAEQIEEDAIGDPLTVARLQFRLGRSLQNLGESKAAKGLLEKSGQTFVSLLDRDDPEALSNKHRLSTALHSLGEFDRAANVLQETIDLMKVGLGPHHVETLRAMGDLGRAYDFGGKIDRAVPQLEEAYSLSRDKLGPDHEVTLNNLRHLGLVYHWTGKTARALPLLERMLESTKAKWGPSHPETLEAMTIVAFVNLSGGNLDRAMPLCEEALKLSREKLGSDHPTTLSCLRNLGRAHKMTGKHSLALPFFEEIFQRTKSKFGDDVQITGAMADLAGAYRRVGKLDQARSLMEKGHELKLVKWGPDHPDTLTGMNNLAHVYLQSGDPKRALSLCEEAYERSRKRLGTENPVTLACMSTLAGTLVELKEPNRAIPLFEEVLRVRKANQRLDDPDTLMTMTDLATAYRSAGKFEAALPLLQSASASVEKQSFQFDAARTIVRKLAECLEAMNRLSEAETWRRKWLAAAKTRPDDDPNAYSNALIGLGGNLFRQKKWPEGEAVYREIVAIAEKKAPDEWPTFNATSLLGGALLAQRKFADAEPLLLKGYEGMKQREQSIPSQVKKQRLCDALDRLIAFYTAVNKPDEVKKWKAERAKYLAANAMTLTKSPSKAAAPKLATDDKKPIEGKSSQPSSPRNGGGK
jgi:eukaryotic-like serine/threonine-protein kinase